jgi:hypothetical protein
MQGVDLSNVMSTMQHEMDRTRLNLFGCYLLSKARLVENTSLIHLNWKTDFYKITLCANYTSIKYSVRPKYRKIF